MADYNTDNAQVQDRPGSNPALERLDALIGEWSMEGSVPSDPTFVVRGRVAFEWLTWGHFLVQRWDVAHADAPDGIAIASQGGFEDNPYQMPHFVLAHEVPGMEDRAETDFTFVTDGIAIALAQAKAAANDKNVCVAGGANVVNQCLRAGLLDEIRIHLVPVLLGDGIRLFDRVGRERIGLESTRVIESPEGVTHMTFRVIK